MIGEGQAAGLSASRRLVKLFVPTPPASRLPLTVIAPAAVRTTLASGTVKFPPLVREPSTRQPRGSVAAPFTCTVRQLSGPVDPRNALAPRVLPNPVVPDVWVLQSLPLPPL